MPELKNKVLELKKISWEDVKKFELNGLKDIRKRDVTKLKKSIIKRGFFSALMVWENLVFDGAGRVLALKELEKEGYKIPEIPCQFVEANNLAEAKIYALQMSSQHGDITQESLYEFVVDIPEVETLIDEVDFYEFNQEFGGEHLNPNELGTDFSLPDGDKAPFQQMTFTLADQQAELLKQKIEEIKKTDEYKYCETFGNENSNGNALYTLITRFYGQS